MAALTRPETEARRLRALVKITWRNYRRLPDGEIHVRDHLALIGPNDSGKSSVLRGVDMRLGMTRAQLTATDEPHDPLQHRVRHRVAGVRGGV